MRFCLRTRTVSTNGFKKTFKIKHDKLFFLSFFQSVILVLVLRGRGGGNKRERKQNKSPHFTSRKRTTIRPRRWLEANWILKTWPIETPPAPPPADRPRQLWQRRAPRCFQQSISSLFFPPALNFLFKRISKASINAR